MPKLDFSNNQRIATQYTGIKYNGLAGIVGHPGSNECFSRAMEKSQNTQFLDLRRIPMNEKRIECLIECLRRSEGHIKKLSLGSCQISKVKPAFDMLCNFLRTAQLESVDFSMNWISDEGLEHLLRCLGENPYVQHVRLRQMNIEGEAGGKCLGELLKDNTKLLTLDVGNNRKLGMEGARQLAVGLAYNKNLSHLDLTGCQLGDVAAALVIIALVNHPKLSGLNIARNQLALESLSSVTRVLSSPKSCLRSIDLSYNSDLFGSMEYSSQVEDRAILSPAQKKVSKAFASVIRDNQTLKELRLSYVDINESAIPLFKALETNRSVQVLEVVSARLGISGFEALMESLEHISLRELVIDLNCLSPGDQLGQQFERCFIRNKSICSIYGDPSTSYVHQLVTPSPQKKPLHLCVQKNRTLKKIRENPDHSPAFWIQAIANLGRTDHSVSDKRNGINTQGTIVYQVVRNLLPYHSETFTDWIELSNHKWEED